MPLSGFVLVWLFDLDWGGEGKDAEKLVSAVGKMCGDDVLSSSERKNAQHSSCSTSSCTWLGTHATSVVAAGWVGMSFFRSQST